ncbi:MAG: hypothetical protein ACO1TE_05150 [Prosthecobacter sp.]
MRAFACLLLAMLPLCGCGKKKAPAKAKDAAAVVTNPTLLTEAPRLGLAARIPVDVEFCVSTVNLRQHRDALKASRWWKELLAYVDDFAPASKGAEAVQIDEAFLAFGKGAAQELTVLRQLNDLYNETAYRGMMSGGALAALGTSFDTGKMVDAALADNQVLEAVILLLERFEMPPMMLGFASPEPEKVLQKISNALQLAGWMGDAPQSRIVTTQKEQITVNEIAMNGILTVERRQAWLEDLVKLMPRITPETRDRVARALDVLANKSWVLALGLSKEQGRAYVAVAQKKEQVYLANAVGDSMLARPGLRFADGQARRQGLGLIACWDGAFLDVLQSNEPFMPIVRGLLDGLRSEKMFIGAAQALEPLVKELGAAEQAFYRNEHTDGASVAWWEKGLNVAWEGGVNASEVPVLSAPSRFTALLDDPSILLGVSGQGAGTGLGRAYFEAWARLAHTTAEQLIQAGVGGAQAAQTLQWADAAVLPPLLEIYDGTKTIWQKALGNEGAFLLDVGGKMPALPGLPPGGENVPLPRLALVQDIKNRPLIATSWQNTEAALQRLLKSLPTPQPVELPQVTTRRKNGVTSHAYVLPLDSEDVLPCVSLTDQLFMLGTSRRQQLQIAEGVSRSGNAQAVGMRVKLNFIKLREFLKAFASARGQGAEFKSLLRWLEPLEVLETRAWGEGGVARGTLTWGMHDVLSYD